MADDRQFLYNIPRLNRWFALTSILLLGSIGWMVWDDYSREWKRHQRRFRDLEFDKTRERIQAAEQAIDAGRRQELEASLQAARQAADRKEDRIRQLQAEIDALEARDYRATQVFRFTKAELAQAEYFLNEALKEGDAHHVEEWEGRVAELRERLAEADDRVKTIAGDREDLESSLAGITGEAERIQGELTRLYAERDRHRKKLQAIDYTLPNLVRNLPILDFMNPSLRVQQQVLPDILLDISFITIPRVDRCTSCHLGIDRPEYAGEEAPFTAHPNLDLMVADSSPHPKERFGCTGCHQGLDRATSFVRAAHTPSSRREAEEWEESRHWHALHHWEYPMWSRQYVEAACHKCHSAEVEIAGADKFNRGKHLFEELGCHGCHKVEGFENLPKIGPDLKKLASKAEPDWVYRWIAEPKAFRPSTKMPQFFFTANRDHADDIAWNHAEVEAITAFLFERSERPSYPAAPPGDPDRGRSLTRTVGCQGCHLIVEEAYADLGPDFGRFSFGPSLQRIGEKVNPGWLFGWLQNPRRYHPESRMPDLRLTRREAADITAYLMTLRRQGDGAGPGPDDVDPAARDRARDDLMRIFLRRNLTREQAEEKLTTYSAEAKKLFLGERLIRRYGCAGCHSIAGFENAQRIGTELTEEGHKIVRKFDFGAVDIERTVPAWLYQKMKNPRIFDLKREVAWENKLRMPDYGFSDQDAEAVVTMILSLQKRSMRPRNARDLSATEEAIEEGRRLVKTYNCRGCHIIEGRGGTIRDVLARELPKEGIAAEETVAFAPPNLYREGSKVQPDWLFRFLLEPETIRPWLQVRMPSFPLTDREATVLARYFAYADGVDFPFSSEVPERLGGAELQAAQTLFSRDYLNCTSCHQQGARKPEGPPSGWAPDFALARRRLRSGWIEEWLRDPQALMPGTKMPGYFTTADSGPPDILDGDEERQIEVLRKYLLTLGG